MKKRILDTLRKARGDTSGETLSSRLGISRVSVWKHIRKLQECGYQIAAGAAGYRLVADSQIPYPWEFDADLAHVHYYPQVPSTMIVAREKARKGCPDFTVVVAGCQTRGRGRLDRRWVSADGGLYFTLVLRPLLPPALAARVNFAASLTLAQTLRQLFTVPATVKWPNDILVNGRKIAGMLSEMEAEADRVAFINIGIGLNVNNDPAAKESSAIALIDLIGEAISLKKILTAFIDRFRGQMNRLPLDDVIDRWKRLTSTLDRPVRIVTYRQVIEGMAVDVDADGALIVRLADGSEQRVVYGDCFYR